MRALLWGCRISIVLFLLVFSLKNTEFASVRFIFDSFQPAPLIVVALAIISLALRWACLHRWVMFSVCGGTSLGSGVKRIKRQSRRRIEP
jgi:uncharacterized integral membrane protein